MKLIIISAVLLLGLGGFFIAAQDNNDTSGPKDNSASLSIQTVKSDVASGGELLDVRTPAEYAAGHVEGATNLPLQDIQAGVMPSANKDKPVYVYCRSGNRSNQAAAVLKAAGYTNVIDLGAMSSVQSAGGVIKS